jgi:hypothetical protein
MPAVRFAPIVLKTYGPPRLQGVLSRSAVERIRPRRSPRWRYARPGPHKLFGVLRQASWAPFDCQTISLSPSRKPRLRDRRFRSDRTNLYAATDTALASNGFPRCSTAQAILASLLAKATTATLRWVLRISSFAHRPSGVSRSAIWGSAARAP